ncbi:hypothetical protein V1227_05050 [Lentzea sp. DG1S-22]|uniref:hypothetical protein n=1 Tax=Lentzea sp. DG1S-22 TaxID=3108822 RepID=UPI002E75A61F|nr:hypothetical protein [Lentzea sp. DG1S-22]WVH82125.1 hypothetical protein V1227_05050 [Lentzea sp. DG1S-22]
MKFDPRTSQAFGQGVYMTEKDQRTGKLQVRECRHLISCCEPQSAREEDPALVLPHKRFLDLNLRAVDSPPELLVQFPFDVVRA